MSGNLALRWERGSEFALAPIIGAEALEVLDRGELRGARIVERKADLTVEFTRHIPSPRFERVEARLIETGTRCATSAAAPG